MPPLTLAMLALLVSINMLKAQADCPLAEDPVALTNPTLVGNGTPASCTPAALQTALSGGGDIQCNCGPNPVTINLTAPLLVTQTTVLDGQGLVTLSGGGSVRILDKADGIDFTLQNMMMENGRAPNPNIHFSNRCGGALLSRGGGILKVINCHFENNTVTNLQENDIAGGAVYVFGEAKGIFSGCTFVSNSACCGGAIGGLGSDVIVANCLFEQNSAVGVGVGVYGDGGAIYLDGVEIAAADKIYSVCGSQFIANHAVDQGGASCTVFSDNVGAKLEMDQCHFEGNYLTAADAGNGGAIFHVVDDLANGVGETQFTITRSSFVRNYCNRQGGGIWAIIAGLGVIENCTFYRDSTIHTTHGLGGAMALLVQYPNQGGFLVRNNTFAHNYAGLAGGAVFSNPVAPTTWQNNLLYENYTSNLVNVWQGQNVNRPMDVDLGENIQWPTMRPNGSNDTKATATTIFQDPLITLPPSPISKGSHAIMPYCTSPGLQIGSGCPLTDQGLVSRSGSCDLGALSLTSNDALQVTVSGIQTNSAAFVAGQSLHSDATINGGAQIEFSACNETNLQTGFEVFLGSILEIR